MEASPREQFCNIVDSVLEREAETHNASMFAGKLTVETFGMRFIRVFEGRAEYCSQFGVSPGGFRGVQMNVPRISLLLYAPDSDDRLHRALYFRGPSSGTEGTGMATALSPSQELDALQIATSPHLSPDLIAAMVSVSDHEQQIITTELEAQQAAVYKMMGRR